MSGGGGAGLPGPMLGPLSRRRFLAGGAGLALGALASACGSGSHESVKRLASVAPAGGDLGAIEHVIFFMQENRSFDSYLGTLRGVDGFDDHHGSSLGAFAQPYPENTTDPPVGRLLPWHLATAAGTAWCVNDPDHNWGTQHRSWNGGKMDRFVEAHVASDGAANGPLVMGYYDRGDLPYYYALADAFTVCDHYHCSVIGPTHPNRLMSLSASIDPDGGHGGPVIVTNSSDKVEFTATWATMPERLSAHGISWKTYNPTGSIYQPGSPLAILASDNVLLYFKAFSDPASELYKQAFGSLYPTDFMSDLASGNLPQVSWIVASDPQSEHPPSAPAFGEAMSSQIVSALAEHPEVWAKTVLFITYDENGGFFDHVTPPTPAPGTPGEYLGVSPLPAAAEGIGGPIGLGFRVPMLVVSPFSRGGWVSSETFDHTSMLRFLETRFGVEVPNLSAWRRSVTGDLTGALDLRAAGTTALPPLPAVDTNLPGLDTASCNSSTVLASEPVLPVPSPQSMPTQEPGTARHRPR